MLYDPKWNAPADVLSLEGLVAWLETKDPRARYDYDLCNGKCLYGQYMAHHEISWQKSGACGAYLGGHDRRNFCNLVYQTVASELPWTFGAALKRARAVLAA
jgi:hypothetical protein